LLFSSRCACFAGCSDASDESRTSDAVLFEFLMENRLSREIQPFAAKHSSNLREFAGNILAARRGLFQLLGKLQIGQRFAPAM